MALAQFTTKKPSQAMQNNENIYLLARDVKSLFYNFCHATGLQESLTHQAWFYWENNVVNFPFKVEGNLNYFFACLMYGFFCEKKFQTDQTNQDKKKKRITTVSVFDILLVSSLRMIDFFENLKELMEYLNKSEINNELMLLQRKFCVTSAMFNKFERIRKMPFKSEEIESMQKLCWTLFLVVKDFIPQGSNEIQNVYNLLLSCFAFMIPKCSPDELNSPYDIQVIRATEPDIFVLETLCLTLDAPFCNVSTDYIRKWKNLLEELTEAHRENKDEMITILNAKYDAILAISGDFDERFLLDKHSLLMLPFIPRETDGQQKEEEHIARKRLYSSSTLSVNEILETSSCTPSIELKNYFARCSKCAEESVHYRIRGLRGTFTQWFFTSSTDSNEEECTQLFTSAVKLYWRKMEAILRAEEHRLQVKDFSVLLNSEAFHKALLAASVEVVFLNAGVQLKYELLQFPWVIDALEIQVYDFFRITESFLLYEPYFERSVLQHFNRIEEHILLQLVWKSGSSIFKFISEHKDENLSDENFKLNEHGNTHSSYSTDEGKSHGSAYFIRKVCQLAKARIQIMCEKLSIKRVEINDVLKCLEYSLLNQSDLIVNRHLDQLIMCAIYAIAKVADREIQFRQIVMCYKNEGLGEEQVFKRTLIKNNGYDSIITFYNVVYMPAMKYHVLQYGQKRVHEDIGSDNRQSVSKKSRQELNGSSSTITT